MAKWVYTFDDPEASSLGRDTLGNKGMGLIGMYRHSLSVPPGFVITTQACMTYLAKRQFPNGLIDEINAALSWIENRSQKRLGDPKNALIVSVRSGAPVSLPGMLRTIKNVGLTRAVIKDLGSEEFIRDTLSTVNKEFSSIFNQEELSTEFDNLDIEGKMKCLFDLIPEDPKKQIELAIETVFKSWESDNLKRERALMGLPPNLGTACVVQMMVFGNRDQYSGSGVVHTRDPQTGKNRLRGDFAISSQGDAVVSGQRIIKPEDWDVLYNFPGLLSELKEKGRLLEKVYGWAQDIEFTIDSNRLWLLQTRRANLSPRATIIVAVDMYQEGLMQSKRNALKFALPALTELSINKLKPLTTASVIARGVNAVAGAASGSIVISSMRTGRPKQEVAREVEKICQEVAKLGKTIILVTDEMDPELVLALEYVDGILSYGGGKNCHLALVARKKRIPTIVGCDMMRISDSSIVLSNFILNVGDDISIDGSSGNVYLGFIPTVSSEENAEGLIQINQWMDELDYRFPWALGAYPELRDEEMTAIKETIPQIEEIPWQTEKARVIELLMRTFPKGSRIGMTVVDSHDKERLLAELYRAVDEGFEPGVRSCYVKNPPFGKAPWEMGLSRELVRKFVAGDSDYIKERRCKIDGTWGTYPDWINSSEYITELIVMDNPPGLGLKDSTSREHHFVFNVQCDEAKKEIVVELLINTDQLRDIERLEQSQAIYISMQLDPNKPYYRQSIQYRFGYHHVVGVKKMPPLEFWDFESNAKSSFLEPKAWKVASTVAEIVFENWWKPPFALPYRMMFLSHHDLDVLEVQGRCDKDGNVEYALIYDCKGRDETRQAKVIK